MKAMYTRPIGDGTQWVMDYDDYHKNGFNKELATIEDMPKPHKLAYMELLTKQMREE